MFRFGLAASAVMLALVAIPVPVATQRSPTRVVTDMAGRQVRLPAEIRRIATLNSVPVINSLVLGLGQGEKIINGMPDYASTARYKYARLFTPSIVGKPNVLGSGREPNIEALLAAAPDVAFTMDRPTVDVLERNGIPVIFLSWRQPEDIARVMRLMGDVLNASAIANDYLKYFNSVYERVNRGVFTVPRQQRPRVLYCNLQRLTQDQLIGEWWIEKAGGISVTNNGRTTESFPFSLEQMFAWDPDILVVATPEDVKELRSDRRFASLKAVKSNKVYVAPIGAHLWTNRTIEQPLTLLWAAHTFLPSVFATTDLVKETQSFYTRFFHVTLTADQAREILSGTW